MALQLPQSPFNRTCSVTFFFAFVCFARILNVVCATTVKGRSIPPIFIFRRGTRDPLACLRICVNLVLEHGNVLFLKGMKNACYYADLW